MHDWLSNCFLLYVVVFLVIKQIIDMKDNIQSKMQQNSRHLNFNKFIEERAVEISKFLTDLEVDTKKKGHQSLPKSIRRRAMSHNRFRIPRKIRQNIESQLVKAQNMQKLPKCRKHIRKRRHLIMAYKMRDGKVRWLSTHLWATKRMRMINYRGYKIAFTPNDKSFRSAYRHFRHNCCLVDLSYFQCLSLKAKNGVFTKLPDVIRITEGESPLVFDKIYTIQIFTNGDQMQLICPAYMLRSMDHECQWSFKCFFDPISLNEIRQIKLPKEFVANLEQSQMDMYFLVGPESINVLNNSLRQYGMTNTGYDLYRQLHGKTNHIVYLSKQQNYSINPKPLIDFPVRPQKLLKVSYDKTENTDLRKNLFEMYQKVLVNKQSEVIPNGSRDLKQFWKYYEQGQNTGLQKTKFKITLRSRYTHKRKNKLSKEQKRKIDKIQKESPAQKPIRKKRQVMKDQNQMASDSGNYQKLISVQTPHNVRNATIEAVNPILIAQISKSNLFGGVLVWCSNANSCRLWRILTHQHLKVIGRRQYAHIHLQSNQLLFPEDYAQTTSFQVYQSEQQKKCFERYSKTPINKRPHFVQISSPLPFSFLVPQRPLIVSLEIVSRGRCFENSYICELQGDDLNLIINKMQDGKMGIVLSETEFTIKERKHYKDVQQLKTELVAMKTVRRIVGTITSGGFLYSRCREGGIGFINTTLLSSNYLQVKGGYFLIRKVTSLHYMLAKVTRQFV